MPDQRIVLRCEAGHEQVIRTPQHTAREALSLAGILDGTSAFYAYPPRQYPLEGSELGRCQQSIPGLMGKKCLAWFTARIEGYDAPCVTT